MVTWGSVSFGDDLDSGLDFCDICVRLPTFCLGRGLQRRWAKKELLRALRLWCGPAVFSLILFRKPSASSLTIKVVAQVGNGWGLWITLQMPAKIFSGNGSGSVVTDMARLLIFLSPLGITCSGGGRYIWTSIRSLKFRGKVHSSWFAEAKNGSENILSLGPSQVDKIPNNLTNHLQTAMELKSHVPWFSPSSNWGNCFRERKRGSFSSLSFFSWPHYKNRSCPRGWH